MCIRDRYQVFVSSPYRDLIEERLAVVWKILAEGHIPAGMEMYPATDDRGWKIIQQTIDASDYYVVIVGGMYGSVREDTGKSWTEEEYEYARATGKTILAFPREPSHITVPNAESQADRIAKHRDFVNRLLETHHCKRCLLYTSDAADE